MSRFNLKVSPALPNAVTSEGVPAFSKSAELELVTILLTSFGLDQFYKTGAQQMQRVRDLARQVGPEFAAKAAVYARDEFGMRTITHVLAADLARASFLEKQRFFQRVVVRPDDALEIVGLYFSQNKPKPGKRHAPLPSAMKRAIARALEGFTPYQLAKYKNDGKAIRLVDLVNLCHPKATHQLGLLVNGKLEPANTWEVAQTQAGQKAAQVAHELREKGETEEEIAAVQAEIKAGAWRGMILSREMGHMALLRNLRNIRDKAPDVLNIALEQLKLGVGKARVFPYRYLIAGDVFAHDLGQANDDIRTALSECVNLALSNVPVLPGRTLIAVDNSASMTGFTRSLDSAARKAAIFGSAIALSSDSDLLVFSDRAVKVNAYKGTPITVLASELLRSMHSAGTNFGSIFATIGDQKYDRIVILTDNEAQSGTAAASFFLKDYRRRSGADPNVFVFDLAGSSTVQFPENKLFMLSGFSEKTLDLMAKLESDRTALLSAVNSIVL